jgi:hypothetical protein
VGGQTKNSGRSIFLTINWVEYGARSRKPVLSVNTITQSTRLWTVVPYGVSFTPAHYFI